MRFISLFFLLVFSDFSSAQEGKIYWNSQKDLIWGDFKAQPNNKSLYAAMTSSVMSYTFSAEVINNEVEVKYNVKCFFDQKSSWCKPTHLNDLYLLKHEQLHFDITELYTRKFRKELGEMKFTTNVKAEIRNLYNVINEEKTAIQKRYDLETNHSAIETIQKKWELLIKIELKKYIDFASK
jgi:hypothetical protein